MMKGCRVLLAVVPVVAAVLLPLPASAAVSPRVTSATWSLTTAGHAPAPEGTPYAYSSVAVGDLEGTGQEDIVAAFPNGVVEALDANGHPLPGWPKTVGSVQGSPTLADLRGDGKLEVIVASMDGRIYIWNGDGTGYPGWPQSICRHPQASTCGAFASPAVGDLLNNGQKEIVIGSFDSYLYGFNSNGTMMSGFPIDTWDTVWDTPTLVDLEGTGKLDIVIGADSSGPPEPEPKGGTYWAFRPTGCSGVSKATSCQISGWPRNSANDAALHQTPWSSSASRDLGSGPIIAAGTGQNFPGQGNYFSILGAHGGSASGSVWPKAVAGTTMASPAIGSIPGASTQWETVETINGSQIRAFNVNGSDAITAINHPGDCTGFGNASPIIAPVTASQNGIWAVCGNHIYGWDAAGAVVAEMGTLGGPSSAAPTVADLGDGQLSLIQTAEVGGVNGNLSTFTHYSISLYKIPATTAATVGADAWPTFHGSPSHSGVAAPQATPPTVTPVGLTNEEQVTWSAAANSVPATANRLWVRDQTAGTAWQYLLTVPVSAGNSADFYGKAGHTYDVYVQAESLAAQAPGPLSNPQTAAVSPTATQVSGQDWDGIYAVDAYGSIRTANSPVLTPSVKWDWNVIRGIGINDNVDAHNGGWVMDGWGALHAFGNAPTLQLPGGYWPGHDTFRQMVTFPNRDGGYVLDFWGGVHEFGSAVREFTTYYTPGHDDARGLALDTCDAHYNDTTEASYSAGYTLDETGAIHPFGGAPAVTSSWTIKGDYARSIVVEPSCSLGYVTGYVLDAYGGVHPFTQASHTMPAQPHVSAYWPGWNIARAIVAAPCIANSGWVVDGYGNFHPYGSAPAVTATGYTAGQDVIKDATAVAPAAGC